MNPPDEGWHAVEESWRSIDSAGSPVPDLTGELLAGSRRRGRRVALAELLVAAMMIWLGVEAVREHPGPLAGALATLIALHLAGLGIVSAWNRGTLQRLLTMNTRTFLRGWRAACRRQLMTIRVLAGVLMAEAVILGVWVTEYLESVPARVWYAEAVWFAMMIALLASSAWIFVVRARVLRDLSEIARVGATLEEAVD